jgi:hypothetical protein
VADDVVLLRYVQARGRRRPTLRVIKSRTSDHERGTFHLDLARVGSPVDGPPGPGGRGDGSTPWPPDAPGEGAPGPGGRGDGAPPWPPDAPGERDARSRRKGGNR